MMMMMTTTTTIIIIIIIIIITIIIIIISRFPLYAWYSHLYTRKNMFLGKRDVQLFCSYNSVEPLITDTAGEFKFCPLQEVYVSWSSSSDLWRRFGE
jgi:flagellar basal body-associated protein FliL